MSRRLSTLRFLTLDTIMGCDPMITKEQTDIINASVAFAYAKLVESLASLGVTIINTHFAHTGSNYDVIDGTQKKGFVLAQDPIIIGKALGRILESVLSDVAKCEGANGYLLNYLHVEYTDTLARVVLRGCPTIAPADFDFAKASAALTAPSKQSLEHPYGFELLCHPGLVRPVPVEADA